MFKRKKQPQIDPSRVPRHIGLIIDGNGRWAKQRGLTRSMGHQAGFENVKTIIKEAKKIGVEIVTVYAFSTENWNRPQKEVDFLMNKFREMLKSDYYKDFGFNPKLNVCGDPTKFDKDIQELIVNRMEETKNNTDLIFNLCINYGGRSEIVNAVNRIIKEGIKEVTAESFSKYLYTANQPDPDLIIRTSGELRISGFLLWQCAYSEFSFPKVYWPAFTIKDFHNCILEFQNRDRKFGSIKE